MQDVQAQSKVRSNSPLLLIFLTIFVDLIGFGIVIPILPIYAESTKFHASPTAIGWLMGSYSLAQFIFTPLLGRWSDRVGRRPILFFSVLGTALAFIAMGMAQSFWMLLIARVVDGITGGNISTAQAYIADITQPEDRAKGLGVIGAAFGLGFIFGPAIGGELSRFGLGAPFYFAAALAVINAVSIYFLLPESLSRERRAEAEASAAQSSRFEAIAETLRQPELRLLVLISFILTLSFATYQTNFALFAKVRYDFTPPQIGRLFVYIGVIGAIVQGVLIGRLTRQFGERRLLISGLLVMTISSACIPLATGTLSLLAVLGVLAAGSALITNLAPALISQRTAAHKQGTVLGVTQSIGSLARFIGPALGGIAFGTISPVAPFILCALMTTLALILSLTSVE